MSMNPDVKARWLKALRDPETKQTHGNLRNDEGMCCLGVLCEVVREETNSRWMLDIDNDYDFSNMSDQSGTHLIGTIVGYAKLRLSSPCVMYNGVLTPLIDLNDSEMLSFAEIADLIEEQL